jgi:hypothetical protein
MVTMVFSSVLDGDLQGQERGDRRLGSRPVPELTKQEFGALLERQGLRAEGRTLEVRTSGSRGAVAAAVLSDAQVPGGARAVMGLRRRDVERLDGADKY